MLLLLFGIIFTSKTGILMHLFKPLYKCTGVIISPYFVDYIFLLQLRRNNNTKKNLFAWQQTTKSRRYIRSFVLVFERVFVLILKDSRIVIYDFLIYVKPLKVLLIIKNLWCGFFLVPFRCTNARTQRRLFFA